MSSLNSRKIWQETMKKWNSFHLKNKKKEKEIHKEKIDEQEIGKEFQTSKRCIKKGKDVLLLFSGGIGSTTALYELMKMKRKPIILYVEGIESEKVEKDQKKILVRMALECRCDTGKPLISIVSNTSTSETNSSHTASPRTISWFQSISVRSESQKISVYERFLEEGGNKDFFPFFKILYLQTVLDTCYEGIPKEKKPQIIWGNLFHVKGFIHSIWGGSIPTQSYLIEQNPIVEKGSISFTEKTIPSTKGSIPLTKGSIPLTKGSIDDIKKLNFEQQLSPEQNCVECGGFSTETFDHFILFSNPLHILKKLFEAEKISNTLRLDYRIKVSDISPTTILPLYVSNLISSCGSEKKISDSSINNNNNNNNTSTTINVIKTNQSELVEEKEKTQKWKTFPFLNHCWQCMDCMWWRKEIETWIYETEKDKKNELPIFGEGSTDKRDFIYSFRNLSYKETNSIPSLIDLQKTEVFWSKVKKREWILFTKTRGRKKKIQPQSQPSSKNDPSNTNNRPRFQLLSSTRLSTTNDSLSSSTTSLINNSNMGYDESKNQPERLSSSRQSLTHSESFMNNKEKMGSGDNEHSISLFNSLNFDTIDYDEESNSDSSDDDSEDERHHSDRKKYIHHSDHDDEENEDTEEEQESEDDKKKKKRKSKLHKNSDSSSSNASNSENEDYDSDTGQLKKLNLDQNEELIDEDFNELEDIDQEDSALFSDDSREFNEDD